jgi:VWFA-related protein
MDLDRSPRVLRRLAQAGGGRAFFPDSAPEVTRICREIAEEIRNQYTLAFAPSEGSAGDRFHKIRVRVKGERGKQLIARTREGYYEIGKE